MMVAIAALLVALAALRVRTDSPSAALAPTPFGLAAVYTESAPVTGTGPGLVVIGRSASPDDELLNFYRQSALVTGTGPDLARIAPSS
jgi:hypothetical protein